MNAPVTYNLTYLESEFSMPFNVEMGWQVKTTPGEAVIGNFKMAADSNQTMYSIYVFD